MVKSNASSVIATANTPSLNASSLDLSTCRPRLVTHDRQDLLHRILDLALPARHVLAGKILQDTKDSILAFEQIDLLPGHLVQGNECLMVGDGPTVTGGLRPVRADLQRDHDGQLRQVEDGKQQWPWRLVEADDVAKEQPGHDADGDEHEDVHGPAELVHGVRDLVQEPVAPHMLRGDQPGPVHLGRPADLRDASPHRGRRFLDRPDRLGVRLRPLRCGDVILGRSHGFLLLGSYLPATLCARDSARSAGRSMQKPPDARRSRYPASRTRYPTGWISGGPEVGAARLARRD